MIDVADDQRPVSELNTIQEIIARAERDLSPGALDYGRAGAGEEVTVARNRAAWRSYALRPNVLRGVGDVDTTTRFLGMRLDTPVLCAPVGSLTVFHPDGAAAVAEGAAKAGTAAVVGILSSPPFGEVQARSGGRNLFQIYISGDDRWLDGLLEHIDPSDPVGYCVTVDSPVRARRDRLLLGGAYDWRIEREGIPPNLEALGRDAAFKATFDWSGFERLRGKTQRPLVIKGIMNPADAVRAVDLGADAVYVSNHGGRELDHGLSTIEVLQEIVDAVGERAEVVCDSGILHGADVCKALAVGVRAVLIGRLQCWGLGAGGADGVARALELLGEEVANTMAMLGARSVAELTPANVRRAIPV